MIEHDGTLTRMEREVCITGICAIWSCKLLLAFGLDDSMEAYKPPQDRLMANVYIAGPRDSAERQRDCEPRSEDEFGRGLAAFPRSPRLSTTH